LTKPRASRLEYILNVFYVHEIEMLRKHRRQLQDVVHFYTVYTTLYNCGMSAVSLI